MNTENTKIKDVTYGELVSHFKAVERTKAGKHLSGYIVFTEDSFTAPYDERARTYAVSSNNKAFQPSMGGYSIYGSSLDGTDPCVRLEQYMAVERGGKNGWIIERCYLKTEDLEQVKNLIKAKKPRSGDSR